ncbi:unnamed protein product [Chironomus riparius]|uniref:G-protein coupled receptors family 1 profile domain-containing protein n=1 Tax=Chironomus riparius TaxID=315576 RepID=A0A9N9RZ90_9DIPT|nr:unnamed protein product [Chironomus riparius]
MDFNPFNDYEAHEDYSNHTIHISPAINITKHPYENLFKGISPVLLYFASVCCVLFMLLGIPGNLCTIIALARCKKVRNATAVFIINLSCSDLLFCCFNLPLAATTFYYREWVHGEIMCRLFPVLRYGLVAVSLFTILTITINRYIMIGHPRIYPRIYRRRWLTLMVSLTWLCAFGTLIQTWRGKWGKFGMDTTISSCSILPVNGKSPKEFLFIMAFILPCLAIVLCYASIFYIVRKTAMKTHEMPKTNGSIRMTNNHMIANKNSPCPVPQKSASNQKLQRPSIEIDDCNGKIDEGKSIEEPKINSNVHTRRSLMKSKTDELKFIDTSCESDLPPTLSQLQRKSVQIEEIPVIFASPPTSPTTLTTTIISLENEQRQFNSINNKDELIQNNVGTIVQTRGQRNSHDMGVDSAVEDSTVSLEQNNMAHHLLSVPEPSSSSSGIELPYEETPKKKKPKKPKSPTKIKQKKIKAESPPKDLPTRKKSLANTSGASILYGAARMSAKDRRLLKMILVIFISFLTCYLPITLTKIARSIADVNFLFITSYLLIYLTPCINPIIYVVMSSEYRQAYKQLLTCHLNKSRGCNGNAKYQNARNRM